ncbi:hypothetical protein MSG28_014264 [Choristoneura fumiferana]|uniref:Uncharacterized protein n=1 Tax=Choristoneura fumiferana TaxID=7141 RepID=A0ACC0JGI3_CHOFU|nr:hypothetical protein MSG28_014264 [Choristoneura fumiferana]
MSKLVLLFVVILAVVVMQSGVASGCEALIGWCRYHEDCCSMWCAHSWLGDYCSVRMNREELLQVLQGVDEDGNMSETESLDEEEVLLKFGLHRKPALLHIMCGNTC